MTTKDEQLSAEAIWAEEAAKFGNEDAAAEAAPQETETPEPEQTEEKPEAGTEQGTEQAAEAAPPEQDEWAGVPEIVRKRFTAMEDDFSRREHALKSKYGRDIADLKRQLETAKPPQADLESLQKWKELNDEFSPIAEGVKEYVDRALATQHAPQTAQADIDQLTKDAVSGITEVDVDELVATEPFLKWIATRADLHEAAQRGGVRGGVKVVREYKKHLAEIERAAKLSQDREKRLKGSQTPVGQSAPGATSDGSTLSEEQLWEIEARNIWKEKTA